MVHESLVLHIGLHCEIFHRMKHCVQESRSMFSHIFLAGQCSALLSHPPHSNILYSTPMKVYCPHCGKSFKDNIQVQNHLNQPYSACLIHYNELIEINTGILKQREGNPQSALSQPTTNPDVEASGYGFHGEGTQPDFEPMDVDVDFSAEPVAAPRTPTMSAMASHPDIPPACHFKERYPNASETYGAGSTFMDVFDQDTHFAERKLNIFYLFASRDEWELASFLLRSNLSLASMDKFLKLTLVSWFTFSHNPVYTNIHRFRTSAYHFEMAKTLETELKCFLLVQPGRPWRLQQLSLPKTSSTSSTVTLSSV